MNGVNFKVMVIDLRTQLDAQRLRADTAEADALSQYAKRVAAVEELSAAEQRTAELSANNQQLRKLLEQTLAALNPTKALSKSIRAALNPNPEAESHE